MDSSSACPGIVNGPVRQYTQAEKVAVREKVAAEVTAQFAEQLGTAKGIRHWWLEFRMKREIESRIQENLYGGI